MARHTIAGTKYRLHGYRCDCFLILLCVLLFCSFQRGVVQAQKTRAASAALPAGKWPLLCVFLTSFICLQYLPQPVTSESVADEHVAWPRNLVIYTFVGWQSTLVFWFRQCEKKWRFLRGDG